eukprot:1004539-Rhodomonas_salina.1
MAPGARPKLLPGYYLLVPGTRATVQRGGTNEQILWISAYDMPLWRRTSPCPALKGRRFAVSTAAEARIDASS